ncbi:alpha-(1,3)-fucosyltransferase C-like [Argopecten irradians]|uniref:alpha-(1,3)-fucosyltransferase C-like n=1 Tax=Argopecten irradians TaxID=31199 RepID=UPI003719CFF1
MGRSGLVCRWRSQLKVFVVIVVLLNMFIAPLTYHSVRAPAAESKRVKRLKMDKSFLVSLYNPPPWLVELYQRTDPKQCRYTNCRWSVDKYLHSVSDVIVFHGPSLDRIPIIRSPDQTWVMISLESPLNFGPNYKLPAWKSVFNWTMTYRKDSDIYFPYSEVIKKENFKDDQNYTQVLKDKKYSISWAVSHCGAASERDKYVEYLNSYVDDINTFGKCGKFYCGEWEDSEICFTKMAKEHKFVLSFENSFCTDYITEKAFIPYTENIVPIVRGGSKYSTFLPKGTYIDTNDFTTVKELADHIIEIDRHRNMYQDILTRKNQYTLSPKTATYQRAICQVCEKLNTEQNRITTYSDITAWLWKNGGCFYPKDVMSQ